MGEPRISSSSVVSKGKYLKFFLSGKGNPPISQLNFDTRKRGYVINKEREEKGGKKYKKMKRTTKVTTIEFTCLRGEIIVIFPCRCPFKYSIS